MRESKTLSTYDSADLGRASEKLAMHNDEDLEIVQVILEIVRRVSRS